MIWSEVEVAALLICSCIPSLRQVISKIPWLSQAFGLASGWASRGQYNDHSKPKDGSIPLVHRHEYIPSSRVNRHGTHDSQKFGTSSRAVAASASNNDSQEEILPHKTDGNGAILVTKELARDVEYDAARTESSTTLSFNNADGIEPAYRTT